MLQKSIFYILQNILNVRNLKETFNEYCYNIKLIRFLHAIRRKCIQIYFIFVLAYKLFKIFIIHKISSIIHQNHRRY